MGKGASFLGAISRLVFFSCLYSLNRQSFAGNSDDWPVVPIFGRRKRPRQAFYASPSQDICGTGQKEIQKNKFQKKNNFSPIKVEDDISLADFDNDNAFQKDIQRMEPAANQFGGNRWQQRKTDLSQIQSPIKKPTSIIPLQRHPRWLSVLLVNFSTSSDT